MNDALKMQISAFVDGELTQGEAELLIQRLSRDDALMRKAALYLEIGRLLRGERNVPGTERLRERLWAAIGDDTVALAAAAKRLPGRWQRPAAGVAVAASVAVLAIAGLQQLTPAGEDAQTAAPQPSVADAGSIYTEPAAGEVMSDRPGEMLMQYYLSHGATSGDLGANGILTRMVTLELRGGELIEVAPEGTGFSSAARDAEQEQGADSE